MSTIARRAVPDGPVTIRVLGSVDALRDGHRVPKLTPAPAEALAYIALCDPDGITGPELIDLVSSRHERIEKNTLERRISVLRNECGIPFQDYREAGNRYVLQSEFVESIDSADFARGVAQLPLDPTIGQLDALLALWRGDPWPAAGDPASWPWARVIQARDRLLDRLVNHPGLPGSVEIGRFAQLFPALPKINELRTGLQLRTRVKPRLLVVEDQIIDEICVVLDSEFDIVQATSLEKWNEIRDTLAVDAALVDRHLEADLADNAGTTVVAEHLRRYTEIPVALMSVAVPSRYQAQGDLRLKYRLVEIVRKNAEGRVNGTDLLDAARLLVDPQPRAQLCRFELWVDSDEYHVRDQMLLGGRRAERRAAEECLREAEALRVKLRAVQLSMSALAAEVRAFHQKWGPARRAARS